MRSSSAAMRTPLGPGHIPSIFAGTSLVEFSPTDRLNQTMEVGTRNMEAVG
jgi:hypothetical protein